MPKALDLKNKRFTKLKVDFQAGKDKFSKILWNCTCDCGNTLIVTAGALNSGNTKSCGCLSGSSNRGGVKEPAILDFKNKYQAFADINRRISCIHTVKTCLIFFQNVDDLPCQSCKNYEKEERY